MKIGYEISFNRYFFKPAADAVAGGDFERISWRWRKNQTGLLDEILGCRPINQAAPGSGSGHHSQQAVAELTGGKR